MSYILDALRKADAERERDPARGIHAQPAAPSHEAPRRGPLRIVLGAGAVVIAAGVAWLAMPDPAPVVPAAVVAAPAPAPVQVQAQVREAPPPPAPVLVAVAASVSPPAPPPLPAPVREPAAPKPAAAPVAAPAAPAKVAVAAPAAPPAAVPAPVAAPAAPAPAAAPAANPAERILAFAELPPEVQRDMLRLKISGGVHSDNASQRMLIVGGQVMNEGAEIAPGVVLEQIRARTAVLKYRAYRFSVAY